MASTRVSASTASYIAVDEQEQYRSAGSVRQRSPPPVAFTTESTTTRFHFLRHPCV
jgi:hypothetical protein